MTRAGGTRSVRFVASTLLAALPIVLADATGTSVAAIPPAATTLSNPNLLGFEEVQLTDSVIAGLDDEIPDASAFAFDDSATATKRRDAAAAGDTAWKKKCKTYPGDSAWPSDTKWKIFNKLLGGALIKTVPEASPCYNNWGNHDAAKCDSLTTGWGNSSLRIEDPTSIRSIIFQGMTCMPANYTAAFLGNTGTCTLGGFPEYTVNVSTVAQVQLAVNFARSQNIRLVIKNTGHDFGAKSTGKGGLNIWTHHLKSSQFYPKYQADSYNGPAFKLGAGIQVYEANKLAKDHGVTLVGGEGKTVGMIGGYIQGGGHSPVSGIWGMAADQVLSVQMVTADGRFITADSKTNSDIFWAVRGGGGSVFGVVTSMVVKAMPKIKVTTMMYNTSTGGNFTQEKFWQAHKIYVDNFDKYASKGIYAYYRVRHVNGEIFHDMTSMVAPNMSKSDFTALLAPQLSAWEQIGVPFTPLIREYDNYADAWEQGFPQEAWTWGMRQASRLVPRDNIVDPAKRTAMTDSLREVFDGGANLIMFNIRNPPGAAAVANNAVNPAWRNVLMFALMFVTWNVTAPTDYVTQLSRNLTYTWNPKWRALTPGSGTYQSESDYIEPNWQQSFHGTNYPRLYSIKQKWDPHGVFYAQNGVGSEDWQMSELILGHLPSQNSKLCRK